METYTSEKRSKRHIRAGATLTLHEPTRELLRGEERIRLQEQPFQILQLLLARCGTLVSRDELRDRLWPDGTFVDFEHSLNAAVKRLRAALRDDAKSPEFIETVPRLGYRWISGPMPCTGFSRLSPATPDVLRAASSSRWDGDSRIEVVWT
jgi:DNA-binding winged helix-turn-helix (wHTH) protein